MVWSKSHDIGKSNRSFIGPQTQARNLLFMQKISM